MTFNSLEQIIEYFDVDSSDIKGLRKELKKRLKKIHPDKNNGIFNDDDKEKEFHEIQTALEFLKSEPNKYPSLTRADLTSLASAIQELANTKQKDKDEEKVEKKKETLTNSIQESIQSFHKKNTVPKITGVAITLALSALWTFPNVAKEHPILSTLYKYNVEFTFFWILSIIGTAILWIRIKSVERNDAELKKKLQS